jgi:hypothetical protein
MFETIFGLFSMNSTDTPTKHASGRSGKNRVAKRQYPEGNVVPIAVNWDPNQDDENAAIKSFMESSAIVRLSEQWLSKSAVQITSAGMDSRVPQDANTAEAGLKTNDTGGANSRACDEEPTRERVLDLFDKLNDGLQWTVVEHKNSEWYMSTADRGNDPILEKTMDGWLQHVAEDANTPRHLLDDLALSEDYNVRMAVADNPNTPVDLLMVLVRDEHLDVRYALAENHNIDTAVHKLLMEDDNPYVADRARRTLNRLSCAPVINCQFGSQIQPSRQFGVQ